MPKKKTKKLTRKFFFPDKDRPIIDTDLYEGDPFPELTKEIEKGGWSSGIKYVKKKIKRKLHKQRDVIDSS